MKVLIISPSLDPQKNVSGISSVVNNIMQFGEHMYFHFELGSTDENISSSIFKKGWKVFKSFIKYIIFVKKSNPNVVHMNVPTNKIGILREFVILRITRLFNKKIIVHLHGGEFLMQRPRSRVFIFLLKSILLGADRVLALSEVEKDSLRDLYDFDHARVLYNGVDTNVYHKDESICDSNIIRVLYLGRIHESKGVEDLVAGFEKLYKEVIFKFTLCGAGILKDYMINSLSAIMGNNFEYKGVVSGNEKKEILMESDIFILPSRYGEGLPMALLETMSVGLIPVVSNDASIKYVVKDNENGIIVEKYNPEDIYVKLKALLMNRDKMKKLSVNARKTVIEKYDVRKMVRDLEHIYEECLLT